MSLTVFENQNLDFKVSLIKMKRALDGETINEKVNDIVELTSGSVLDLQISESSLSMGAKGTISIDNTFNILERLDLSSNSPDDLYIALEIVDVELAEANIPDENKVLTLVGLVTGTGSGSAGPISNAILFSWEEAFVASTKLTQVGYFDGKGSDIGLGDILSNTNALQLCEDYNNKIYKLKSEENITVGSVEPNTTHNIKLQHGENASVYDAIQKMVKESGVGSEVGKTPYFRFVNSIGADGKVKRLLKYDAFLSDRHVSFASDVAKGKVSGDYSDVYLEKFFLGPMADAAGNDPNASIWNRIEEYNITRADIGTLRNKTWGNYYIPNTQAQIDPGLIQVEHKTLSDIQVDFVERELNGEDLSTNLPLIDQKELKVFHETINTLSTPGDVINSHQQLYQKVNNKVIKSFLTLNESITFSVKGKVYRQPNKFIWIERGINEEDYKKLWYVNSVTHKFSGGQYRTQIVATKIFGDTSLKAIEANKVS